MDGKSVRCMCMMPQGAYWKAVSMNVVEIDAASNNGVENIRDIREQVQYPPTAGKIPCLYIDEVHMLSIGAFQCPVKDFRGTAVLCDLYSGYHRGTQDSHNDPFPMPEI